MRHMIMIYPFTFNLFRVNAVIGFGYRKFMYQTFIAEARYDIAVMLAQSASHAFNHVANKIEIIECDLFVRKVFVAHS